MTLALLLCGAALLTVLVLLAGCGSSGEDSTQSGGQNPPSLFGDKQQPGPNSRQGIASDKKAEADVRTGVTAMETYAADHNGSYVGVTAAELQSIDPAVPDDVGITGQTGTYTLSVYSQFTGTRFEITKTATGQLAFNCTNPGSGDCPQSRDWSS